MRVIVIGTEKQAKEYAKYDRNPDDIVIPVGPWPMRVCNMYGWKTRNLSSLWTIAEYEEARTDSEFRINTLIAALNDYSIKLDAEVGIEIGNYYAFQLWVIIGQIHLNHFIIKSIVRSIKFDKILVYTSKSKNVFMEMRPDPDTVFAEIFINSKYVRPENLSIKEVSEKVSSLSAKEWIFNHLPKNLNKWLVEIRKKIIIDFAHRKKGAKQLLLIGAAYEWLKICSYNTFTNQFKLKYLIPLSNNSQKDKPPQILSNIVLDAITFERLPVYNLNPLINNINSNLLLFAKNYKKIQVNLKQYNAIVASILVFPWENYIAHMAVKINKPVILWQHGEKGSFPDVTIPYTEINYVTHYFSYGPAVKKKEYDPYVSNNKLKAVESVGSLGKKIVWKEGKNIIYATGKWFKTASPFLGSPDPDYRLFTVQKTILEYLNSLGDTYSSIFKANNTPGLNEVPHNYLKVKIDYRRPFIDLLANAAIVILDTPGTTLVEACSTKVPIFVVGGSFAYYEDFKKIITKRVVWCETADELVIKLNLFFQTGIYEADVNNDDYINNYCVKLPMEQVVFNVNNLLLKIVDEYANKCVVKKED